MDITKKNVEHVAELARLEITEQEKVIFTEQLSNILGYVEMLNELDTGEVSPTSHVVPLTNVFREDQVGEVLEKGEALKNAPEKEGGYFKVPRIIE